MKTLNSLNDSDLVSSVKHDNCSDSLTELSRRYSAVCYDICKKYAPAVSSAGFDIKDLTDQSVFFVYKSCLTFNPDKKVKFSTWLGNFTKYQCLNTINQKKTVNFSDEESMRIVIENKSQDETNDSFRENKDLDEYIFNILNGLKDERISKVFKLRYFSGEKKLTWQKVARKLDVSTQTAINLHEKGRLILRNKLESKEISDSV